MPITLSERMESRGFIYSLRSESRFRYVARGTDDDQELLAHLITAIPDTYEGLVLESIRADPIAVDEGDSSGLWDVEAIYLPGDFVPFSPDESTESFDTSGGTQHTTQSLATVGAFVASGTAPNHKGAIGVNEDSVEGVDIVVPVYSFEESHPLSPAAITPTFKGNVFSLTGRVNDASFKGFAAGEVLFLGARGQRRGFGLWNVQFLFAASPNLTNVPVGDITVSAKLGWHYLWVQYKPAVSENSLVKVPKAAYVERVYRTGDFSLLGIGT
jgi:hypothetical protein